MIIVALSPEVLIAAVEIALAEVQAELDKAPTPPYRSKYITRLVSLQAILAALKELQCRT